MRENLAAFDKIMVPCAIDDYVTSRILTMELVAQKRFSELVEHAREAVAPAGVRVLFEERGDLLERLEILDDPLADAGPLHLHRDRPVIVQRCAMHLPERRGRERLRIECSESLRDAYAQLDRHDRLHFIERERLHPVLES